MPTSFVNRRVGGGYRFECSCGAKGRTANTQGAAPQQRIEHMKRHGITVTTSRARLAERDAWDRIRRNR
ncbi:hypothetical protein QTO28_09990 [Streptomyces sp. P9-2B-1]|uniref:hypothetical protein n=1 Tax=Streptomyces sp. P9-2B-1 TaxID=3057115 RepID=UPI0025B3B35C|nr:hypothetical protein [Streptomyces sp. P9-2B-1]WJY31311.1 hypothetical protein QTO28_09990 [Streptomyces sp. P9-2B-1]